MIEHKSRRSHPKATVIVSSILSAALRCPRKKLSGIESPAQWADHPRNAPRQLKEPCSTRKRRHPRMFLSHIPGHYPQFGILQTPTALDRPRHFRLWMKRARPAVLGAIVSIADKVLQRLWRRTSHRFPTRMGSICHRRAKQQFVTRISDPTGVNGAVLMVDLPLPL